MADTNRNIRTQAAGPQARGRQGVSRRPSQGQKTTSHNSGMRVAERIARSGSHAQSTAQQARSSSHARRQPSKAVGVGAGNARARAAGMQARPAGAARASVPATSAPFSSLWERLLEHRALTAVLAAVLVVVLFVLADTAANWGRAYGNVSINGMSVAGMTAEDMRGALDAQFGAKLPGSQVSVYASEEARERSTQKLAQEENAATAEQVSAEDAKANVGTWTADGATLKASLPYDQVISEALEAGRKGGPFGRIALALSGQDVELSVLYDETALDTFASDIDASYGNARQDATVSIDNGHASVVEGHDGTMVDRSWLAERLSDVMLGKNGATYVIAEASETPSRTTSEQAERMAEAVNKALAAGVAFTYKQGSWTAEAAELGNWTRVDVVQAGDGFDLSARIDAGTATSSLVKNLSAAAKANTTDVVVDFEKTDAGIQVNTSGAGEIPEVSSAIEQVNEGLFGQEGVAWSAGGATSPLKVDIQESNAPETLSFNQALDLGLITVIGEYTTEFSNEEGTENRNHNIKLVSDILDETICESNGGQWSFNTNTGDTNLDPPFASAGSIVNGEYVDSIGGGICQVATTVFNAVFEAGLDVVDRRNHSLYIASYPTGRDVGVSYPELDFVWANNLKSDVLLLIDYTDTTVTAKLYSVYTGYKVESSVGEWEEGSKYVTEFEVDDSLAKGDYYIKTTGEDGSKVDVTRTVTDAAGNVVSETLFESVYEPKNEVYLIGPGTDTAGLARGDTSTPQDSSEYDEGNAGAGEDETEEAFEDGFGEEELVEEGYDDGLSLDEDVEEA